MHLGVTALLLQVGQFSFVYTGLSSGVPAGLSSLILGMAPLLVGLLTPLLLATRLGVAPVLGLLIGAVGVYVVLADDLGGGIGGDVVFPVLGMLSLTAGTLYQKRFNDRTPVVTSVVVQMGTSLVATLVAWPFLGAGWVPSSAGGVAGRRLARDLQLGRGLRTDVPAAALALDGFRVVAARPGPGDDGAVRGPDPRRAAHGAGRAGSVHRARRDVRRSRQAPGRPQAGRRSRRSGAGRDRAPELNRRA
ncbi:Permease of the drug/metabolite transporter (DMT) superfamily [Pseudonocardia sp. Ae168_Ps1]|uniref:hypothetical protein n=1 Tax=Pseudonocardia sp. Ae150A_Ps1 TaxID=1885028 RepID=UPI00095F7B7C|nr:MULTISPECIES: hypothetical protein [unclassified Pseudonocardia]OLL73125.1 Permease of the drug/metabolite transporter (DMT) superfamily [Pseudonocardia sp. Ae150A_Ps1]OLL79102.1 Permease of the drug/metabolite transporter (DMT) superfamily [Pseudonocardia sp. Ae168_Ps1]OLL86761.1 Permease of the drug/metabolite transporter (DMT) superfamily [Pseudonocardia sp. Ae263_Ps1]OLL93195.1 Permease of the drug/metabolite transporter (DMT) superfamily [Pseudonocardia sp. Ae356_Ps1]